MPKTSFNSTNNPALVRSALMSGKAFKWAQDNMFFKPFVGKQGMDNDTRTGGQGTKGVAISKGTDSIITMKVEPKLKKRQTVDMYIRAPLTGTGQVDNAKLKGNEEAITFYEQYVTVHKRRHGVSTYEFDDFKSEVEFNEYAKDALGEWLGQTVDTDILLSLSGLANDAGTISAAAPTTGRVWYGGQTTAGVLESVANHAAIDSSTANIFGTKVIEAMKRLAQTGTSARPKLRPIMYKGKKYYVMLVHPLAMKALRAESAWINATKDGWHRGESNPIFSGAEGVWEGVIIHEWEKIETRLGAGGTTESEYFDSSSDACASGITVARNLFCGAQSGVVAIGRDLNWKTQVDDYENEYGVSIGAVYNAAKTKFNSNDYGVIAVNTAVVLDS